MSLPTIAWFCKTVQAELPSALSADETLGSISIDTRTIRAGDLFWALAAQRDGHEFVREALSKGAKGCVVNRAFAASLNDATILGKCVAVEDTNAALTRSAKQWRENWSFPVLGITGTNGKTSTKDLTIRFLERRISVRGTQGNLNNEIGVPLTVLAIPNDVELAVVEMGASHAGEIGDLCQICRPTHGLVTSIGRAHLEGFGSLETISRTKGELYDFIAKEGVAFVPTDDPMCLQESSGNQTCVGYGFGEQPAGWRSEYNRGTELSFDRNACASFVFHNTAITLHVPGKPAALTALAALTIARSFGVPLDVCVDALDEWRSVKGRMSVLDAGSIRILDDCYNANPVSMRAALETLSLLPGKRHVAILGDMNELGEFSEQEHEALGRTLKEFSVRGIFAGKWAETAARASRENGGQAESYLTTEELLLELRKHIEPGDVVLVKGSRSNKLERVVDQLKEIFG